MPGFVDDIFALAPPSRPQVSVRHTLQKHGYPVAGPVLDRTRNGHAAIPHLSPRFAEHDGCAGSALLGTRHTQFVVSPDEFVLAVPTGPGSVDLAGNDQLRVVGQFFE